MVVAAAVGPCLELSLPVSGFVRLDFVAGLVGFDRYYVVAAFAGLQYCSVEELAGQHCSGPSVSGAVRQRSERRESEADLHQNFEAELGAAGQNCFEP